MLDADPDLGRDLTPEQLIGARRFATADVIELGCGGHDPGSSGDPDLLGLLVLDGLAIRTVNVADRRCGELIGPGALVRPWDQFGQQAPMPFEVSWSVLEPVRLAVLDQRMTLVCARWPALLNELMRRALERSDSLAFIAAIHCLQHVELRLVALLWHLADRFGHVTPDGTHIPLKLTHSHLAQLTGCQRPSVSSRLRRLSRQGVLSRRPDRSWLLHEPPPSTMHDRRLHGHTPRHHDDG